MAYFDAPRLQDGFDKEVADWTARKLGMLDGSDFGPHSAVYVTSGDHILAGVVYNNFHDMAHGSSIEMTVAAITPRWLTRPVLRGIFGYPFRQLEVRRLSIQVARRNRASRGLVQRVGFRFEGIARRGYDGRQDAAIYSMLPHECRWL